MRSERKETGRRYFSPARKTVDGQGNYWSRKLGQFVLKESSFVPTFYKFARALPSLVHWKTGAFELQDANCPGFAKSPCIVRSDKRIIY